jgi:hypothetical protein
VADAKTDSTKTFSETMEIFPRQGHRGVRKRVMDPKTWTEKSQFLDGERH